MKRSLIFIVLIISALTLSAQNDIKSKVANYNYLTHPEKLYITTDCNLYHYGDTIWFSSWLLNYGNLSPEKLEKILEINLINSQNGKNVVKQIVPIEHGRSKGQIIVPPELESGTYQLVGNTNYMRNQGEDFFFSKTIVIQSVLLSEDVLEIPTVSTASEIEETVIPHQSGLTEDASSNKKSELDIVFLPEGGNWIPNVPSKMAFYGTVPGADTVDYSGIIYDNDNNIVTFIKPVFRGRGSVNITPLPGKQYYAIITDSNGIQFRVDLPMPDQSGKFTLSVNDRVNSPQLKVGVYKSPQLNEVDTLKLVVVQHGDVVCQPEFLPKEPVNVFNIEKAMLQTGIAQITLFDTNNKPLCERLVFINNDDFTHWESQVETSDGNTQIAITSKDKSGQTLSGDYAVSVYKIENQLDTLVKSPDIVQYLYLNADLPGLENDCSYFLKKDAQSFYCADLVMLTNGWRRYNWDEVIVDTIPPPDYPLEQKFYISGIVRRTGNDKAVKDGIELTLLGNGEDVIMGTATTNDNGAFYFPIDHFNNASEFVIQTKNKLNLKADFNIELKTNLVNQSDDYSSKVTVVKRTTVASASQQTALTEVKNKIGEVPAHIAAAPLPEPAFEDTTDVKIMEVTVNGKRILSPEEKMYKKFGSPSWAINASQIAQLCHGNKSNYGLISLIEQMIPGFHYRLRGNIVPYALGSFKACNCLAVEMDEKDPGECFEFSYNGQSRCRFYIYVDGQLCAFTNHGGQVDWAKDGLFTMDVIQIDKLCIMEHPKNDALMDAITVPKALNEFYNPSKHIYHGCLVGYENAPARVILITTKSGWGINGVGYNRGMISSKLSGFTPAKEFYIPKFKNNAAGFEQFKTIYWNPSVRTDKDGQIHVKLSGLDPKSKYMLVINGMSGTHEPGSYFKILNNDIADPVKIASD